jgi:hypothetical protein
MYVRKRSSPEGVSTSERYRRWDRPELHRLLDQLSDLGPLNRSFGALTSQTSTALERNERVGEATRRLRRITDV